MRRGPVRGRSRQMRPFAAAALGVTLTLTACGGGGGNKGGDDSLPISPPNVVTNDAVRDGGSVTMALEKNVPNFNNLSADGNGVETQMVLNGIFPSTYIQQPDFTVKINDDLLDSASVTNASPQ